jgi:hypothetical protein
MQGSIKKPGTIQVASDTQTDIGSTLKYAKEKVKGIVKDDQSLLLVLADAMSEQELVDFVEYLAALKNSCNNAIIILQSADLWSIYHFQKRKV